MNRGPVFALTIWQPYAWCIVRGYKPVENRIWRPPKSLIHASAKEATPC